MESLVFSKQALESLDSTFAVLSVTLSVSLVLGELVNRITIVWQAVEALEAVVGR